MAINADAGSNPNLGLSDNILSQYYSYTYNFTLSLYDQAIATETRLPQPTDNRIIIAQTGVTSQFVIRKVEIQTYPGSSRDAKGTMPLNIAIEIDEALGFSLVDRLLQAGVMLGLPTLNNVPYVLELSFTGWDENGNAVQPIIGTPKVWVMNLLGVVPDFTKTGTTYALSFVPQNNVVQDAKRSTATKSMVIKKEPTLVATLNNLAEAFTNSNDPASEGSDQTALGNANNPNLPTHTYKIVVQDGDNALAKISTWTMQKNAQQGGDQMTASSDPSTKVTDFNIVVDPGSDIFSVITGILANTNEAYKLLCPAATPDQTQFTTNQLTSFFHFETTTVNTTFNAQTGSYSQLHTITVVPKYVTRNSFNTTQPGDETAVNNLMNMNLLSKVYNYILTGENTDVLDLNINLSTFWTDSMPLFMTLLKSRDLSVNQSPSLAPANLVPPPVVAADKTQSQQSTNQLTPFQQGAKKPDQSVTTNSGQGDLPVQYIEQLAPAALTLENFSRKETDRDYSQTISSVKGYSTVGNIVSNSKLSIFGWLADQAYSNVNNSFTNSMLNVTMMVRGDPYWLGISPEEVASNYTGKSYSDIRSASNDYAVYQSGESNFALFFRMPQGINDETGLMNINETSSFNTVYSVLQVNHIFEKGMFKQELVANVNRSFSAQAVQTVVSQKVVQHGATGSWDDPVPQMSQAPTNTSQQSTAADALPQQTPIPSTYTPGAGISTPAGQSTSSTPIPQGVSTTATPNSGGASGTW